MNVVEEYAPDIVTRRHGRFAALRCGSGPATLSALAVAAIGVDAGDPAAAEAEDSPMERSAHALHEDAASVCAGAVTERTGVRGAATNGITIALPHRLAGALRPLPAEPSGE